MGLLSLRSKVLLKGFGAICRGRNAGEKGIVRRQNDLKISRKREKQSDNHR